MKKIIFFSLAVLLFSNQLNAQEVKVKVESKIIPTWEIGPPEVNPSFSWSSSRNIYPYPLKEILTNNKVNKTYKACWLENEFVKVLILPEIGGRLHGARDKTNEYNFFYWQPTIKPGLVGMTGAWISGGIEWNFPHGHRPTGFSPVSYRLVENDDGSKTVWVGESEWVYRMRWIVGLTLYPGKSVIEAKVRLQNPTRLRHSFQMWATTAVNANENYQAIYPARIMAGHGKHQFWNWPLHNGTDISWWRNIPNASSYFATEKEDFFGGYDYDKNAGTIITGNKYIVPGKKLWTWGTSPSGIIWEKILTEGQGPYFEPQAGTYSDNQPDYHWIEPGDVKSYSHFFYPVRDIGPFKQANVNGALNMEFCGDEIKIGAYSTSIMKSAKIRLNRNGKSVFEKNLNINPSKPYIHQVEVKDASKNQESFTLSLLDENDIVLVSYTPKFPEKSSFPEKALVYDEPENIKTNDELWHAGDITYKFRNPNRGRAYFTEAIKRDPGDSRSRISLAEMEIKRGKYRAALEHLDTAEKRDPDNGKLFYLRAFAEEALGDYESAYTHYYRSVYFKEYLSIGYRQIAGLDLRSGDFCKAIEHIDKSIEFNALNQNLRCIKASALRLNGDIAAAEQAAKLALELDPLDMYALNELILTLEKQGKNNDMFKDEIRRILLDDSHFYIELACSYSNFGLYNDAAEILKRYNREHRNNIALTSYYIGYLMSKMGKTKEAVQWFKTGKEQPVDYVFPFRLEALEVFEEALKYDSKDAAAHYYMGLVYAGIGEVDDAISHWHTALKFNPGNARALRNLGLSYFHSGQDLKDAKQYYENAFKLAPEDSRILMELDRVKEALGESPAERFSFLKRHKKIVEMRDDLLTSMLNLMVKTGQYNDALSYYSTHHFHNWEGRYTIHNSYMEANIRLAEDAKTPEEALKFYLNACEYPENLEVAPREPNLRGFLYYPMSKLYSQLGRKKESVRLLEITAKESTAKPTLSNYYQALALQDLGQSEKAEKILTGLKEEGQRLIDGQFKEYVRKNGAFLEALGYFYLSKFYKANDEMQKARENLNKAESIFSMIEREALIYTQIAFASARQ